MKIGMRHLRLFILISLISILSITGLYVYAVTLDVTILGEVEDDSNKDGCDSTEVCLDGPMDAAVTTINGRTYVVVSGNVDNGMEIIDISDPASPTSVGRVNDTGAEGNDCTVANGERCLEGANGNAITTIGGSTYAIIVATFDDGIERRM